MKGTRAFEIVLEQLVASHAEAERYRGERDLAQSTIRGLQGEIRLRDVTIESQRGQIAAWSADRQAEGKS